MSATDPEVTPCTICGTKSHVGGDAGHAAWIQWVLAQPCPHCGSVHVDRGATGLDQCDTCGGLSRDGAPLGAPVIGGWWADPAARLAEISAAPVGRGRLVQLPALDGEELLRLRWAVQLGLATTVEEQLGGRMAAVLASLDTAIAEALLAARR